MKKRVILGILVGLVGFAMVAALVVAFHSNVVNLPDGSNVSVEGATFQRPFYYAEGWRKLAIRLVPQLASKLKVVPFPTFMTSNAVVFWTYRSHPPTTDLRSSENKVFRKVVFSDEDGNQYTRIPKIYHQEYVNGAIEGSAMPLLPAPGEKITATITMYSLDATSNYTATLTFRSPALHLVTNFTPATYPVQPSGANGGFELVHLHAGKFAGASSDETWTMATLRQMNRTNTASVWEITAVEISDELGNAYVPRCQHASGAGSELTVWFEGGYSPKTARKFGFAVAERPKVVATNLVWTLPNVPLSGDARKKFRAPSRTKGFECRTVFFGYRDDGAFGPDSGFFVTRFLQRVQQGSVRDVTSFEHFDILDAHDDQQRVLDLEPWTERENTEVFRCVLPANAKTATFTLAAHRSKLIEFVAAPEND